MQTVFVQGVAKRRDHRVLPHHAVEVVRPPFASEHLITHSRPK